MNYNEQRRECVIYAEALTADMEDGKEKYHAYVQALRAKALTLQPDGGRDYIELVEGRRRNDQVNSRLD